MMPKFGKNYTQRPIMPWGKSPCPCGSRNVFRECCRPQLHDLPPRPKSREYIAIDPDRALTLARAEFTRYTIWHATTTAPWFERDPEGAAQLMNVDAEALGDMLATIRAISQQHPSRPEFLPVLDQNSELLPTRRWREVLFRERLMYAWGQENGEAKASELARTLDLDETHHAELLALVLPYREELSVSERVSITDRIIENSESWEDRVRFHCYRAMLWELHGDHKEAARGYLRAVKSVPKDPAPEWAHALVVGAYVHAARSNARLDLLERATELCARFLQEAAGSLALEVELRKSRSGVMEQLHRNDDGLEDRRWIVEHRGTNDDQIQLAQALIAAGGFEEARNILEDLEFGELTPGEQYDHTFALSGLLYGIPEEGLKALVRRRLLDLEPEFPVWREVRDRLLLALSRWPDEADYPAWWASMREALVLQPNVFGIGLDVRTLIDRAFRRRSSGEEGHRSLRGD